jgi:predicted Zn-dependent peptidase
MSTIVTRTLECGMPLLVERIDGVASAAICWLLPAGAASDPDDRIGMSTLWAELLMRGAGNLDSRGHADAMDHLGATRSADVGTYYLRLTSTMLGRRVLDALPLIVDMVRAPRMEPDAVDAARDLALQSLESLKDDPQERAFIRVRARHHPTPVNRSSLGTVEGLTACTRDELTELWKTRATPGRSIFAAAGAVDPDALAGALNRLLKGWTGTTPPIRTGPRPPRGYAHETDQSNQVQIVLKHDAPPENHPDARLEKLVINVLSGGMSGRLFTEVREKRGLCYSVSAGYRAERDFGAVTAYVGTTPERAQESLDVLTQELQRIHTPAGAITQEELQRAVIGSKSRLIFSGESTGARAAALAADQHRIGRPRSLGELAEEIDRVTLDQVNNYLTRRSFGTPTIQTLGPSELTAPKF